MYKRVFTLRIWPIIGFLISGAMLAGAYGFQYIGGLEPCIMCHWQRHAHRAVLGVAGLTVLISLFVASRVWLRGLNALIGVAFLISTAYGFAHVGVEFSWWDGPAACAVSDKMDLGGKSLLDALDDPLEIVQCSDVTWSMLGLSMAGWNALISAVAAFISFSVAIKGKYYEQSR